MSARAAVDEATAEAILALGPIRVESFADVGGGALDLARALHDRHGARIFLVDMVKSGAFSDAPSTWVAPYMAALESAGVPSDAVTRVGSAEEIRPWDVIANFGCFGDAWKVRHLAPLIEGGMHADSVMLTDIRKGSGSYPFLNGYGTCETLAAHAPGGSAVTRAVFRPSASAATGAPAEDGDWAAIARRLAGPFGFYTDNGIHSFLYVPRDPSVLVVTFDNLDIAMTKRADRRPWGFEFIEKQGWSVLGVMAAGWTWYRDYWAMGEFDRLAREGFFGRFGRVVFYGASMGGYAAAAFSAACPGAEVVAISPQSTLDKTVVPWETRYKTVWDKDFSGKYGDAAQASRAAGRVTILYDPYEPLDAAHARRFTGANVTLLRTPLMGHRLGSSLLQMGILSEVMLKALAGSLTEAEFYRLLRARRDFPRYQRELFERAVARARPDLARRVGDWVLKRGENRYIRLAMKDL
ncbi:hypothetical protein [Albidovulum sp.]|jgi:hypothetical protein|uniref:hypothetical protein n=1 Tax=Albidovulum sp. TaxID=1872424 RepID=UPI0026593B38|nr:hypothetical protein [uncultured Defluviimonas sp.]